jgi:hypothetical protein
LIILFSFCGLNSYGAMEYEREESIGYITGEQAALQFFQKGMSAAFSIGFDGLMDNHQLLMTQMFRVQKTTNRMQGI